MGFSPESVSVIIVVGSYCCLSFKTQVTRFKIEDRRLKRKDIRSVALRCGTLRCGTFHCGNCRTTNTGSFSCRLTDCVAIVTQRL